MGLPHLLVHFQPLQNGLEGFSAPAVLETDKPGPAIQLGRIGQRLERADGSIDGRFIALERR